VEKNENLCGNFWQYYEEESDDYAEKTPDYAEKTPDYAEISKSCSLQVNVVARILVLYDMLEHLLLFVDRSFFVQHTFSIVFIVEFVPSLVTRH